MDLNALEYALYRENPTKAKLLSLFAPRRSTWPSLMIPMLPLYPRLPSSGTPHIAKRPSTNDEKTALTPPSYPASLDLLPTLPLDIIFEIFSHLPPKDLLSISRTTRALRKTILSRHACSVWRRSLSSVRALPPCPDDLAEPQYAALFFDDYCQFCLSPTQGTSAVVWMCRVRCCTKCVRRRFISEKDLDSRLPEGVSYENLDMLFPYIVQKPSHHFTRTLLFFLPVAEAYLRELDQVLLSTKDDAAIREWSTQKRELQSTRLKHAALCEYWQAHWGPHTETEGPDSYVSELVIIFILSSILILLWMDPIMSIFMGVQRH